MFSVHGCLGGDFSEARLLTPQGMTMAGGGGLVLGLGASGGYGAGSNGGHGGSGGVGIGANSSAPSSAATAAAAAGMPSRPGLFTHDTNQPPPYRQVVFAAAGHKITAAPAATVGGRSRSSKMLFTFLVICVFVLCCQTSQASPGVQLSYLEFSPSCLVPFRLVFPFLRLRSGGLEIQFSLEPPFHPLIRL